MCIVHPITRLESRGILGGVTRNEANETQRCFQAVKVFYEYLFAEPTASLSEVVNGSQRCHKTKENSSVDNGRVKTISAGRSSSERKKESYKINLLKQEYFERIKEETNNNLAPELTPREKSKSLVTNERRILSVQNKMAAFSSNCYEVGHHFYRECLRI